MRVCVRSNGCIPGRLTLQGRTTARLVVQSTVADLVSGARVRLTNDAANRCLDLHNTLVATGYDTSFLLDFVF